MTTVVAWVKRDGTSGIIPAPFFDAAVERGHFDRADYRPLVFGDDPDTVAMPRRLTAENGAKAALMGEFSVTHYTEYGGIVVLVPWTTIKDIYAAAVKHFHPGISP